MLAVSSSLPDARADAWEGQTLSFFFNDGNSSVSDGTIAPEDVHAVVTHLEYCPLGGGNVLNITVRAAGWAWDPHRESAGASGAASSRGWVHPPRMRVPPSPPLSLRAGPPGCRDDL